MEEDEYFLEVTAKKLKQYILQGKNKKKIEEIYRLLDIYPQKSYLLYYLLAQHYMLEEKPSYEKAIECYKIVLDKKNNSLELISKALSNIAFAYKAIGDIENAIKYLDIKFVKFPNLHADNPELYNKLKNIYSELLRDRDESGRSNL